MTRGEDGSYRGLVKTEPPAEPIPLWVTPTRWTAATRPSWGALAAWVRLSCLARLPADGPLAAPGPARLLPLASWQYVTLIVCERPQSSKCIDKVSSWCENWHLPLMYDINIY